MTTLFFDDYGELQRWMEASKVDGTVHKVVVPIKNIGGEIPTMWEKTAEFKEWLEEHGTKFLFYHIIGGFTEAATGIFYFQDVNDATFFKLRWS